ncbi:hypothetical protein SESBI_15069 [Sesbania bispinosa]|nr:hypothetical protein SESBI_15069 [Sesbania bispinosa]
MCHPLSLPPRLSPLYNAIMAAMCRSNEGGHGGGATTMSATQQQHSHINAVEVLFFPANATTMCDMWWPGARF